MLVLGCSRRQTTPREERVRVPDPVEQFSSLTRHGATTDPSTLQLWQDVLAALAQRGDQAELDESLNDTATWLIREQQEGRGVDSVSAETAAHVYGFAGVVPSCAVFDAKTEHWREQVKSLPNNLPVHRVGIRSAPFGGPTAVVFGSVQLQLDPLPRAIELGQSLKVVGSVSSRFKTSTLYVQKPDGKVEDFPSTGARFDLTLTPQVPGEYRLEVMGDGDTGPVVVSNLAVGVGVPAVGVARVDGARLPPPLAEARLLALLNGARQDMKLPPLLSDADLRASALAHTQDMRDHHFFGHASTTAGSVDDRFKDLGSFTRFGENVILAGHPEAAHQGLMSSPGHRSAMISPDFTHVGIGVLENDGQLLATFHFGRRPPPDALPRSVAQLVKAINQMRARKNLSEARSNAAFDAAAAAGAKALAKNANTEQVSRVIAQVMQAQVDNLLVEPVAYCIYQVELMEAEQLDTFTPLARAKLRKLGVGLQRRDAPGAPRAAAVILVDAPATGACEEH